MPELRELMAAAESGARSVVPGGWMAEECRGAALLGIVRWPPRTTLEAWKRGRWCAIDELRYLTGHRRRGGRMVPWPHDDDHDPIEHGVEDDGLAELEATWDTEADRQRIREWAEARTARARELVELVLEGRTAAEAAQVMGITESRASQVLHDR
jgi:DNA-directed RNA polymerase specialized sigma24 family protein